MVIKKDEPVADQQDDVKPDARTEDLKLNKETMRNLTEEELNSVQGGLADRAPIACGRPTGGTSGG